MMDNHFRSKHVTFFLNHVWCIQQVEYSDVLKVFLVVTFKNYKTFSAAFNVTA